MQMKTERFEMRLDPGALERVDKWRGRQDDLPSRAEAVRRLIEVGLGASGSDRVKLSDGEKIVMLMLCDMFRHLKVESDIDPEFVEAAIHGGHCWSLRAEYPGILHGHEDSNQTISEVIDVIDMWYCVESAYGELSKKDRQRIAEEASPFGEDVVFRGFDGTNESEHLHVADFLIRHRHLCPSFEGRDLNSHWPMLETYRRMLVVFEPMRRTFGRHGLNTTQIIKLLRAQVHPEHREHSNSGSDTA